MNSTSESSQQTPEDLLQELRALIEEAEKILAQDAGPGGANGLEGLRASFEAARERVAGACDQVRRKVKAGARQADDALREHPYQAVAIAAGVGLVLGMLLNRRRD